MRGGDNRPRETRVNERIRAREVRVIDEDGQMLGVMTSQAALALARERNLDLVEVSPMAVPPVCKILDWGRYKYEQSKRENEARKHQKVTQLREIRMKPRTGGHDVAVKVRKIHEFLAEGDKVKVSVTFRGRELAHPELGRVLLDQITEELKGVGAIERPPIMEGKMISMIVSRAPGWEPQKKQPAHGEAPATPAPQAAVSPAPVADTAAPITPAASRAAEPVANGGAPAAPAEAVESTAEAAEPTEPAAPDAETTAPAEPAAQDGEATRAPRATAARSSRRTTAPPRDVTRAAPPSTAP